ncbi:Ribosomal lysine N-methyltransferase 4 [Podospora pseudoanserina]|uniref:Ribosomal lysine N-methyltransferase 4 n=1 Tax=Podospora pseudoanserina TaxID=2609844 RepID=A0ABR0IFK5_9PEZI|nr:Ribosomal lysine N-methyltransferase 4 [Podospora pseudoanserina]
MEVDSDADSRFLEGTRHFLSWFQSLPGATFHKDIAIEDLRSRNAGRGIVAQADIAADTVLFTIPRNSILCAATSPLKDKLPEIFDLDNDDEDESGDESDGDNQNSWTLLILILIHEYLQGSSSQWKPYLDVLPSTFNTPMFWTPSQLSFLQASAVTSRIGQEEADKMIASKILPVIRSHPQIFFPSSATPLSHDQLIQLAHRMGSTIMSYAFDLEQDMEIPEQLENDDEWEEDREGKTMLGMVPMADILNADAEFNAHINHAEDALTAVSLRPIRKGEEILNFYGPLSSAELLRRYGYVTEKHARWDVVELSWSLISSALQSKLQAQPEVWEKVCALVQQDEEFEEAFVLERQSPDPSSTGLLEEPAEFTSLPDELGEQFKLCLKACKKITDSKNDMALRALNDKDWRKRLYLETILEAVTQREREYGTTLEQDDQLLSANPSDQREKMAVWVRRGEKLVLREARAWITTQLEELRNRPVEQPQDEGRAAKRRRI